MNDFNEHLVENDVVLDLSEYIKTIDKDISPQETIDWYTKYEFQLRQKRCCATLPDITTGLFKPIKVSLEMATFASWDPNELKSRVDVIKHLCWYIKTNQLQNPDDERQIIADEQLATLLNYDRTSGDRLTYLSMMKKIKYLFPKSE